MRCAACWFRLGAFVLVTHTRVCRRLDMPVTVRKHVPCGIWGMHCSHSAPSTTSPGRSTLAVAHASLQEEPRPAARQAAAPGLAKPPKCRRGPELVAASGPSGRHPLCCCRTRRLWLRLTHMCTALGSSTVDTPAHRCACAQQPGRCRVHACMIRWAADGKAGRG